jgi:hypothetical protein
LETVHDFIENGLEVSKSSRAEERLRIFPAHRHDPRSVSAPAQTPNGAAWIGAGARVRTGEATTTGSGSACADSASSRQSGHPYPPQT